MKAKTPSLIIAGAIIFLAWIWIGSLTHHLNPCLVINGGFKENDLNGCWVVADVNCNRRNGESFSFNTRGKKGKVQWLASKNGGGIAANVDIIPGKTAFHVVMKFAGNRPIDLLVKVINNNKLYAINTRNGFAFYLERE